MNGSDSNGKRPVTWSERNECLLCKRTHATLTITENIVLPTLVPICLVLVLLYGYNHTGEEGRRLRSIPIL